MVCFASPLVSIWLVCIQEEIRHSFIHSVALRLPFSQTRRSCVQQQLRNVAFKKKNLFNTLWYVLLHSEQPSPTCTLLTARVHLHFLKFFVRFSFSHIYILYIEPFCSLKPGMLIKQVVQEEEFLGWWDSKDVCPLLSLCVNSSHRLPLCSSNVTAAVWMSPTK